MSETEVLKESYIKIEYYEDNDGQLRKPRGLRWVRIFLNNF